MCRTSCFDAGARNASNLGSPGRGWASTVGLRGTDNAGAECDGNPGKGDQP